MNSDDIRNGFLGTIPEHTLAAFSDDTPLLADPIHTKGKLRQLLIEYEKWLRKYEGTQDAERT